MSDSTSILLEDGLHTLSSSVSGSMEDSRSFGFSMNFRKWSRSDEYALLESESFFGQDDWLSGP
jgi:hypothetical protein